ncbi:YceH family protein [Roseimaritima ulvae]|uniref:Uncharacterized protein n=1 Tax=Roseimaritima ulvae TaxID=980254 RepID=A0A5B9QN13_9BACT|nr:YceH family protein [Roseimaritima ulvae]QEG40388.1 hypothetical protein UC8_23980 [Roseimaritima ulvae]
MNEHPPTDSDDAQAEPEAQKTLPPLHPHQRRVLGVLVEKAKTTPDSYPLTLNAIMTGCNQKSNRDPVMQLDADDVQIALDGLRALEAATEIQGGGRVNKFRHHAYDWLGVRGAHAAVMIELMLRGPQTLGEIRSRASRMEKLADLQMTTQVVNELIAKKLVVPLGRPGRGQQFAHTLYQPDEMQRLDVASAAAPLPPQPSAPAAAPAPAADTDALQQQIDELKARVEKLESRL